MELTYSVYLMKMEREFDMRICEICGKKVTDGMTNDCGDFYVHEGKCFEKYMDKVYGKHKWMELGGGEEDGEGGYYIYSEDCAGGYMGTGIYYTEWEEDDEDDENGKEMCYDI